jgi:hypothetical protein
VPTMPPPPCRLTRLRTAPLIFALRNQCGKLDQGSRAVSLRAQNRLRSLPTAWKALAFSPWASVRRCF